MLILLVLLSSIFFSVNNLLSEIPKFAIVVASYNNEKYCEDNLNSLINQKATHPYHIYIINDLSTDKTRTLIENFIETKKLHSMVSLINNDKRIGALANIYKTIHEQISDDKVVVIVDGDDRLGDFKSKNPQQILAKLENIYDNPHIWLTYGQFRFSPSGKVGFCKPIPNEILRQKKLRSYPMVYSHLRTFRAKLFKKIKKEDLQYKNNFLPAAGDVATMVPMIEMCAPKNKKSTSHALFVSDIMYSYNYQNPINVARVDNKIQSVFGKYLSKKKPYEPLESL